MHGAAQGRRRVSGSATLWHQDVRFTRELAQRRFVVSLLRRVGRLVTLHALDTIAVIAAAAGTANILEVSGLRAALPSLVAFTLVGLNLRGSYRPGGARRDVVRLVTGVAIALVLIALPTTIRGVVPQPGVFLLLFGALASGALIIGRRMADAVVHAAYARGTGLRRALIVARRDEYRGVLAGIGPHDIGRAEEDQVIVGYVTPDQREQDGPGHLGGLAELERVLDQQEISEMIVSTALASDVLEDVAESCFARGVRVLVLPEAATTRSVWAELTSVGRLPAHQLHPTRLELPALMVKRASDLMLASIALLLGWPLMLLVAMGIKLESRGPVFFRQRRVGLGGRHFSMWKFRSMRVEAERQRDGIAHLNAYGDGRLFKMPRDPRITRVGRFLRRFSIDELPQLFNVLAGDMSLVGPRPPLPSEVQTYEPRHFVRLSVVPGMTGPWQVNGRNLITNFEQVVRLEREYIETWSLRSDLEIILRTVAVVLSGKGAY